MTAACEADVNDIQGDPRGAGDGNGLDMHAFDVSTPRPPAVREGGEREEEGGGGRRKGRKRKEERGEGKGEGRRREREAIPPDRGPRGPAVPAGLPLP